MPFNIPFMLSQMALLQAIAIDGFYYGPQQCAEVLSDTLELFIERIVNQILVQISDQVNEALLLRTWQGIVAGKEVRDQDPRESVEHFL
jgi:hypothetical protein